LVRSGKADAYASPRPPILEYARQLPGSRVLDGHYGANIQAFALQKGQTGRLAFITHKAMTDVACLVDESLLTPQGRSLYETVTAIFETIRRERADLLTGYTMANQPYSFSYDVFTRMNPISSMPQG